MKAITSTLTCPVFALFSALAGAQAVPANEIALSINGLPMVDALNQWAGQAGMQLIVLSGTSVHRIYAPQIKGVFRPRDALVQMLDGSSLAYEYINERTVLISERTGAAELSTMQSQMEFVPVSMLTDTPEQSARTPSTGLSSKVAGDSKPKRQVGDNLEEIVVSAQRREEKLQDVPISISVLGGDQLDRSTDQGISEALTRVPSTATTETYQGGGTQIAIRGVTAASALFFGSNPIGYYLDYMPFSLAASSIAPDANAYDMERVEVLRGPQGTLYGASALNGVVRVLTKDAQLDRLEFKARTSVSSTDGGGENYRGDAAINVPLVEGKLAARAVIGYQDLSGWIDRPNNKNANDGELKSARLKLSAQPTDNLSIDLTGWLSRSQFGAPSSGDDNAKHISLLDDPMATDYDAYGMKVGYDLRSLALVSTTSYLDYRNDGYLDASVVPGLVDNRLQTSLGAHMFSQEITANSNIKGPWQWSFGGIYRDGKDSLFQIRRNAAGAPTGGYLFPISGTFRSESFAIFGEITRQFMDGKIEVTGGVRYFEDEVTDETLSTFNGAPPPPNISAKYDATSPRVVINWHPNEQLSAYVSYAEGFRSGRNVSASTAAVLGATKPDTLRNYELGTKGVLLDGDLSFDAAVYYIDWQDVQQPITVQVAPNLFLGGIINSESASGVGVELSTSVRPTDQLQLGASFSWSGLESDTDVLSRTVVLFDKGDRLNLSPEYTAGLFFDYTFTLGASGIEASFSGSGNYTSERQYRALVGTARSTGVGDEILIARTSLSVDFMNRWLATLFIDNVNNEKGSPARMPFSVPRHPYWDSRVRPRTIGLQLDYRF